MTDARPPSRFTDAISLGVLTRVFPRDLVDDVLRVKGRTGLRTRLLPGRVIVYFVLALCLFARDPYEEVMRKLVNGLQFLGSWAGEWRVPTSSAITQARQRLGVDVMQELFDQVAVPLARPGTTGAWFHGWRVLAADGVVLDVPDAKDNAREFGRSGGSAKPSPYPQVRIVGIGECGTHAIVGAAFDRWAVGETTLLSRVLPLGVVGPGAILLCDRGFYSYPLWQAAAATGAQLLWRVTSKLQLPVLQQLPDGSYRSQLVRPDVKSTAKQRNKQVPTELCTPVRVVDYTVANRDGTGETIRLLTTILNPDRATAVELAALYQQRWEFELTLDEIETHQMSHTKLLRSQTPELVRQEIWGMLLAHYAVRSFMREAADDIGDDADHLSFSRSIRVLRRQVLNQAGFSPHTTTPGRP